MRTARNWMIPAIVGAACGWLTAQDAPLPPPDPVSWQPLASLRLQGGYKDNVLLSSFAPEGAPFVGAGLDAFLWRPVGESSEFEGFFLGEHREFFGAEGLNHEQLFFGLKQFRHEWNERWRGAGAFEYLYQDQVLDVSTTEAVVTRARVRGHSLGLRSSVRRAVGAGWLDLQAAGTRQLFAGELDDYWQVGPRLTWERKVREATEFGVSYQWLHRWYDRDPERTAPGEPVPGTRRVLSQHEAGLTARHHWGERRRWRLTGRLAGRLNQDRASGYYDYLRPQGAVRLRYRHGPWEWEAGLRGMHYAYRVQRVTPDDGARRQRWETNADVRLQRRLTKAFRVFAEYQYERTIANRAEEEYSVSTVSGGLEWEF